MRGRRLVDNNKVDRKEIRWKDCILFVRLRVGKSGGCFEHDI